MPYPAAADVAEMQLAAAPSQPVRGRQHDRPASRWGIGG